MGCLKRNLGYILLKMCGGFFFFFLQEEEMPEVEIDIDDLLEVNSEDERAVKLQASAFVHPGERLSALFVQ